MALDLSKVDPHACLQRLNASVSKSPMELVPVRPVLEFNMVDARFVEETDVLSGLDQRPNLMELTPSEFESLITTSSRKWAWKRDKHKRHVMVVSIVSPLILDLFSVVRW